MAKGTLIFLFFLTIFAALLFGINIGKKLSISNSSIPQPTAYNPQPTVTPSPAIIPIISASPSAALKKSTGATTYTDATCGFSFSYPGSFINQKTTNGQSTILTDPENPSSIIAATCSSSIPRPPVSSDKIESIMLGNTAATLYHDQNQDGAPRDEVIVKHPSNGMEIIMAGYGENFQQALSSFKFI